MDIKEMAERVLSSFFMIFFCSIVAGSIYLWLHGASVMNLSDIFAIVALSALFALTAELVFYSKRELNRLELLTRHLFHLLLIVVTIMPIAIFMKWVSWGEPIRMILIVCLILGVYVMVIVIDFYRTKKLTNQLTKKLRERANKN